MKRELENDESFNWLYSENFESLANSEIFKRLQSFSNNLSLPAAIII